MIVKIQRPVESSDGEVDQMALIYNQSRSYHAYFIYRDVAHLFKKDEYRIFHKASRCNNNGIVPVHMNDTIINVSLQTGVANPDVKATKDQLMIGKRLGEQGW